MRLRNWALLTTAFVLGAGCSNFKSSRSLNMGPFAENTITMLAEAQQVVAPLDWNYLREYKDVGVTDSVVVEIELLRRVFRGIGFYSIQVVALNNAKISDHKRAEKLATYIEETTNPIVLSGEIGAFGLTAAHVDSILQKVQAQTTYLGALGAINPLVYAVAVFSIDRVDRMAMMTQRALVNIQTEVDRDFADVKQSIAELNALEERNVQDYLLLQDYRAGKVESLEPLLAHDVTVREIVAGKARPSAQALEKAQLALQERLASIDSVRKQLGMRNEQHTHQVAELDEFRNEIDQRNRTARLMLIFWMRSHSNLAQGIEVPPTINLKSLADEGAKKALKSFP